MARPKKYIIKLTEDEFKELKSAIRKKKTSKTIRLLEAESKVILETPISTEEEFTRALLK